MKTITIKDDGKLKTSELYQKILEKYPNSYCHWGMEDLDKYCPPRESERTFTDSIESDPELKGKSWNEMRDAGKLSDCMTVREYMIMTFEHGLKDYYGWTHLADSFNVTIADGYSRYGKFELVGNNRGSSNAYGGFRAVVNLDSSNMDTSLENAIEQVKKAGYKVYKEL